MPKSTRVTVPAGHVAVIMPVMLATEIESYCRIERERLRKQGAGKALYGVLSDLQLAVSDTLAQPLPSMLAEHD